MTALAARIAKLDNKDAIHVVNLIAGGVDAPDPEIARQTVVDASAPEHRSEAEAATVPLVSADPDGGFSGEAARELLAAIAEDDEGAKLVAVALDAPPDETGDFGFLSGPALLIVAWLAVTGDIDVEIGGARFRKAGIAAKDQVKMGERLMKALAKYLLGTGGAAAS